MNTSVASTVPDLPLDVSPLLKPAHVIRSDEEAIEVAIQVARIFSAESSQRDRDRRLPWAEIEAFTASGLGGITVPREYGGADVSLLTLARVFRILCEADPSAGQIPQSQTGVLNVVRHFGSASQKERIFSGILSGWRIGNAGPERNTKTIAEITTQLVPDGDGYRITGRKFYSTGAIFAHWIPVRAVNPEGETQFVFVERGRAGLNVIDDWSGFGQRTTASGTVVMDNVRVDADAAIDISAFSRTPNLQGPSSQLIQAAIDAGIAHAAVRETVAFVNQRARPWMDSGVDRASLDPLVIHQIGDLVIRLSGADAMLEKAATLLDQLNKAPITADAVALASVEVAKAKVLTTEIALRAGEKLFELGGTRAVLSEDNLDRHWRNARTHTLHDPVRWKYHLVGNFYLNDVKPPVNSWN